MGKLTDALKKAAEDRLARIEKMDGTGTETRYQFVARKTVDSKIDPRIVPFYDPHAPVTEQYRTLRTNLGAIKGDKPVKTLTITSSSHGEGKTITAINLAVTLARDLNKKSVLLVDTDLRRNRVHKYLGFKCEAGISQALTNGTTIDDVLVNIGIDNLTVLPAGKPPQNPAELLGSAQMKELVKHLRAKYDYIIFDTPPIIPVTDAGILGAQTDGVVMVIKANGTQKGMVEHGRNLLNQAQAKVLGFILTNVEYHIPEYIYRYL